MKIKKWDDISIKYKLFMITTSLLVGLSIVIFLILQFSLPIYYHKYKMDNLEIELSNLVEQSIYYDLEKLRENIYTISKNQNLAFVLRDYEGNVIDGNNELVLLKYNRYIIRSKSKEYKASASIYTNDSVFPYKLDIIMPLQPIDEAVSVIKNIMPYIILISIIISAAGAYIYSTVITRPLIKIIEKEREQELKRREFIATISHELKTPITIISGQLEGMIYNIGKFKDRDMYLRKTHSTTQELKNLVNEMIDISKEDVLDNELKLEEVNISELTKELANRQTFLLEEKNISLKLKIEDNILIYLDKEKISKVINNLINNAIKYSPSRENIFINLYKKNNKIVFEIENTGITIEKKYLKKIFEPFYRVEKSRNRKTGGSGLGLYIVSQILDLHNAYYSIDNKSNSVVFYIELKKQ